MTRPGSTTDKGYGWTHQQARRDALRALEDGTRCGHCGQPMYRAQGRHLDLDHTDDRTAYRGLAHRGCNRRAGAAKAKANAQRGQLLRERERTTREVRSSRNW
jgi:hypothetical protein